MYIYLYICIYIYTFIHTYIYIYVYLFIFASLDECHSEVLPRLLTVVVCLIKLTTTLCVYLN